MATVTPNFNWPVPTSTDLVKDGATAIEALGDSIDASLVDLKGGTTGQVLAKASNTDLDYTWTDANPGDITGVTAGTGISGGGTSGTVTVTNSMATAIDAKGDLVPGTGADTFSRLAVGANGTVLTADSAEATGLKWATPASSTPTFVGASAYKTTNQTASNATYTNITFDAENFDSDGFHSNVTNNTRMTVPSGKAGKYLLSGFVGYGSNASGVRLVRLQKNGSTINYFSSAPFSGDTVTVNVNYVIDLAVGDYLELNAYQNSGGNLSIESSSQYTTFQVTYLGA